MPRKTIHSSAASGASRTPSRPINAGADDHRQHVCLRARARGEHRDRERGHDLDELRDAGERARVALADPVGLEDLRQPGDGREERHRLQAHEQRDRPAERLAPQRRADRRGDGIVARARRAAARRPRRPAPGAPRSPAPPPSRRTRRSNGIAVNVATVAPVDERHRERAGQHARALGRPRAHQRGHDDLRQRDRRARQQRARRTARRSRRAPRSGGAGGGGQRRGHEQPLDRVAARDPRPELREQPRGTAAARSSAAPPPRRTARARPGCRPAAAAGCRTAAAG